MIDYIDDNDDVVSGWEQRCIKIYGCANVDIDDDWWIWGGPCVDQYKTSVAPSNS